MSSLPPLPPADPAPISPAPAPVPAAGISGFYQKHKRWVPIGSFILGFLFDMTVLHRIDELSVIVQQAIYLIVSGALVSLELIERTREVHPPPGLGWAWKYREFLLHFMLGTLLNSYTIFYFKSASGLTSFIFIALLIALLMLNEFKRFGESQTQVHYAFLSLCLVSYFTSLVPILVGFIGLLPFLGTLAASIALFCLYCKWLGPKLAAHPGLLRSHVVYPFAGIHALFVLLYFTHAIPPVPLSISYMGIFHGVQKQGGEYVLTSTRSKWRVWEHGDQTFLARPGDEIICFAQVYSPTRFKEELQVRWLYRDERRGWQSWDAIPVPVVGGREEGYRAITKKSNYVPGDWRVQIETRDSRAIGRIDFTVIADPSIGERLRNTVVR